jgi:hypothetical protein
VSRRIAIVAAGHVAALHGLEGRFAWGEARTFSPSDEEAIATWQPATVIGLDGMPPEGPWRTIDFEAGGGRSVSTTAPGAWRRALLPAADDLMELQPHVGTGVVVAGGPEAERESVAGKLRSLSVDVRAVPWLTRDDLARAAVVALLGSTGQPPPPGATAVLAAGRVLLLPRAEPAFGLLAWSDHLPYENEDDLVRTADAVQTYPEAFEPLVALGALAVEAHLASAVYPRLAVDAELEEAA